MLAIVVVSQPSREGRTVGCLPPLACTVPSGAQSIGKRHSDQSQLRGCGAPFLKCMVYLEIGTLEIGTPLPPLGGTIKGNKNRLYVLEISLVGR